MTAFRLQASRLALRILIVGAAVAATGSPTHSQALTVADLPDAPLATSQTQAAPQPPNSPAPQTNSSSQPANTAQAPQDQKQKSEEELKQEEKQRIMGVVPNFNTTDNPDALPLSPKQKFHLFFKSSVDPFVFVAAGLVAGEEQATNDFPGYHQGWEGYGKRFGASYADTFDGNLWGNAILPSLWHEDPRYFRLGTGSFWHRAVYSAETNVWSKRDNKTWGPNYANVIGNFISGGISNLYYPASDRGATLTVERAVTVTAEGAIGSELVEFWPDVVRHFRKNKNDVPPAQPTSPVATTPVQQPNGTSTPTPTNPQ